MVMFSCICWLFDINNQANLRKSIKSGSPSMERGHQNHFSNELLWNPAYSDSHFLLSSFPQFLLFHFGYMNLLSLRVLESYSLFSFHHLALKSWYPWISLWLWHTALIALFFLSLEIMFTQFIVLSWILSLNPQNNACSRRLTSAIPHLENIKPNKALSTYITDSLLFSRSVTSYSL